MDPGFVEDSVTAGSTFDDKLDDTCKKFGRINNDDNLAGVGLKPAYGFFITKSVRIL